MGKQAVPNFLIIGQKVYQCRYSSARISNPAILLMGATIISKSCSHDINVGCFFAPFVLLVVNKPETFPQCFLII